MREVDRIAALYGTLTNKERAILAFQSAVEGDKEEAQRIVDSVPMKSYRCADVEYERWYDAICDLSSAYAREYWRLETYRQKIFCRGLIFSFMQHEPKDDDQMDVDFILSHQRLYALNRALKIVCAENGINLAAVRESAGVDSDEFEIHGLEPPTEMENKYIKMMLRLLPD